MKLADAELRQAQADRQFSLEEDERTQTLARKGIAAGRNLEKAEADVKMRQAVVAKAEASVLLRKSELDGARARRLGPEELAVQKAAGETCSLEVKSPESGRFLRIVAESEQTISPGTPLLEIGNPLNFEVVVELLSADAVRVITGASATVEEWRDPPLLARVTLVEPSGFTKVSALGIEEQRVKTILALEGQSQDWERLGHDFRVYVKMDVFEARDALVVPLGALFRRGSDWCVFTFKHGRSHLRVVEIGQRNAFAAELVSGLVEGEEFILHPSDRVADAIRVHERNHDNH